MSPSPQVTVIGNIGIDTNVYLHTDTIDFTVEGNFTENIDYIGQAGGFTARGYAQLGHPTAFIGHVGDDHHGQFIRHTLHQDNINTAALLTDPAGTSRSINIMTTDGQRKNFYDGKSHMSLTMPLDLCRPLFASSQLIHCHLPNWARYLLPHIRTINPSATIACDLQDIVDPYDPYRQDFIQYADILFFSAANHPDPLPLINLYRQDKPDRLIIVGRGADGAILATPNNIHHLPAIQTGPPIIDTNGAGDGLAVGFLTSYCLHGHDPLTALGHGQHNARHTCTLKANTNTLLTHAQLFAE
ncbi:MAG TPA: carbohydrate kinase family protein [Anaerolineae bacterium]|nr:carbohydrate kinase family protein [Anaerolineae bacterium]